MGKNTLHEVGIRIAEYLGLEDPQDYTGHTFRRSAATKCADEGATTLELRGIFGWGSDKMPSTYIANSVAKMNKQAKMLCGVDVNENKSCKKEESCKKRENETETEGEGEPVKKAKKIEITTNEPSNTPNQGVMSNTMENCQITINYLSKSE